MATIKKNAAALKKDLAALDRRIETETQLLQKLRASRKKLAAKIEEVSAQELIGILKEREISFEDAKEILSQAEHVEYRDFDKDDR